MATIVLYPSFDVSIGTDMERVRMLAVLRLVVSTEESHLRRMHRIELAHAKWNSRDDFHGNLSRIVS